MIRHVDYALRLALFYMAIRAAFALGHALWP